jgi:hypothetical protein
MDQNEKDAVEELLRVLSEKSNPMYYFYYDPSTGEIIHMRNYLEVDKLPHIEIPQSEVESNIMFSLSDYQILEKDEKIQLVKKEKIINTLQVYSKIIEIKRLFVNPIDEISHKTYQFDILIEQDTIKREYRIRLSDAIKDHSEKYIDINQQLVFYVTKECDPNIILNTFCISFQDLLKHSCFTVEYNDYDETRCNIFSFYSYDSLHLVIA